MAPSRANFELFARLLALFVGTMIGFAAAGLGLNDDRLLHLFSHQLEGMFGRTFPELVFGEFGSPFSHNLYVMTFFFCIALPFRQGGIMLAMAWNASVWGIATGFLAREWAAEAGMSVASAWLRVMAALTPHMVMEGRAYVLAGLAGVFLSRAPGKHALDSDIMQGVLKTVGAMALLGAGLVLLGAAVEGFAAPSFVRALASL